MHQSAVYAASQQVAAKLLLKCTLLLYLLLLFKQLQQVYLHQI